MEAKQHLEVKRQEGKYDKDDVLNVQVNIL